jgi:hypothetical protein
MDKHLPKSSSQCKNRVGSRYAVGIKYTADEGAPRLRKKYTCMLTRFHAPSCFGKQTTNSRQSAFLHCLFLLIFCTLTPFHHHGLKKTITVWNHAATSKMNLMRIHSSRVAVNWWYVLCLQMGKGAVRVINLWADMQLVMFYSVFFASMDECLGEKVASEKQLASWCIYSFFLMFKVCCGCTCEGSACVGQDQLMYYSSISLKMSSDANRSPMKLQNQFLVCIEGYTDRSNHWGVIIRDWWPDCISKQS